MYIYIYIQLFYNFPISSNFKALLGTLRRGYQTVHTPTGEPPMPGAQKLQLTFCHPGFSCCFFKVVSPKFLD